MKPGERPCLMGGPIFAGLGGHRHTFITMMNTNSEEGTEKGGMA
jgi:hypothetical protein